MKHIKHITLLLVAALALFSCSDDDDNVLDNQGGAISLSASALQVENAGGTATVTVTSSGPWRLAGVSDWAHPSATEGKSGDQITFTIDPNNGQETRTATFKFFTGSAVAPLIVESASGYDMQLASDPAVIVSNDGGEISIQYTGNVREPEIDLGQAADWLALKEQTEFIGKHILILTVKPNATYLSRSGAVTISSPLTQEPIKVDVTQNPTPHLAFDGDAKGMYTLDATSSSIKLRTNLEVTATTEADWITNIAKTETAPDATGLKTVTISFNAAAATAVRGGTITIEGGGLNLTYTVVQKDPATQVVVIPDEDLRGLLSEAGYIIDLGGGACVVTEAGQNATSIKTNWSYYVADFTGIGCLPNLTSISTYVDSSLRVVDLSGLHKLTSLSLSGSSYYYEINLGDNPFTTFKWPGYYSYATSLKLTSSRIETADFTLGSSWYGNYDKVTSIDASGCTALKTVKAKRSDKIAKLYLKQGLTVSVDKNDNTEVIYK